MQYVVSKIEMAELERQTIESCNIPGRVLMEVAGRAAADICLQRFEKNSRVIIACGRGNNGGDGFVIARALGARGHRVDVFVFGPPADLRGDALDTFQTLKKCKEANIVHVEDAKGLVGFGQALKSADYVVDALLGIGVSGEVSGLIGDAIDILCDIEASIVSVDMPSGVCGDTGEILGRAVHADATVTFSFAKRGHYLHPGADLRGELFVVDIGIPKILADGLNIVGQVIDEKDGPSLLPKRGASSHKGSFGRLMVVAGSAQKPGAAILALHGALRGGAGVVCWAAPDEVLKNAPSWPAEVVLRNIPFDEPERWTDSILEGASALVIGPGLSIEPRSGVALSTILRRSTVPLVLDADALNLLARDPKLWSHMEAPTVITPHPKEMARLMDTSIAEVQRDRFATASQFAISKGCVVVLKGAGTVIALPDGSVTVVEAGSAALATAGTGDVLSGLIGALLSQGLDPGTAATLGVLWHGLAGELAGENRGLASATASDMVDALSDICLHWQR